MKRQRTAYITGGASGIARALATLLLSQGWRVFVSDRNEAQAKQFADEYNTTSKSSALSYAECDTSSGFVKPYLSVFGVDLTGVLYTIALALQQFRRQDPQQWSSTSQRVLRGEIALVVSVCVFYCVPSLPIYTAAKHALIGLTRSYGKLLPDHGITLCAVAPNVVRTSISSSVFYGQMEAQGILTPMEGVMDAFTDIIESSASGEVYECGPKNRWTKRPGTTYLDVESEKCCELLLARAEVLH
ncbi:NAD(P)-binding protein [Setomelanomma holmii]|uniref:NAD(P)-binding protein n=1 Tax=Setomelanomma holmii TaxID=210430 RepID=A0A9P4H9Z2_9PLEO|nr:NAD(P)-binding protein [Setomelanomma holmii]